jgi:hypothetical protein
MSITIAYDTTEVELPQASWSDEFDWSPVVQSTQYAVNGSLIVQTATKLAGRPMTLETPDGGFWLTRANLEILFDWLENDYEMLVTLADARTFNVLWNHAGGIKASTVREGFAAPTADTKYQVKLALVII